MLSRRVSIAAVALAVTAGCGGDDGGGSADAAPAPPAESAEVVIDNTAYQPKVVSVFTGGTVTWRWEDGNLVHDVKADEFESELLKEGATFEHTFDEPGTYEYTCSVHPAMKGEVRVVDG